MPTVYPVSSLVQNGGADGSGTHQGASERYETTLADGIDIDRFAPDDVAQQPFTSLFADFYRTSLVRQIINFFKRVRYVMCNPLFLHTDN